MATARSVFRRSREITTAIASTASAASASGIEARRSSFTPVWAWLSCLDSSSVILPAPGGRVIAPLVRALSLLENCDRMEVRSIDTVPLLVLSHPGVVEDLHQLVVGSEIGATPQLHRPRSSESGGDGALQIRLESSADRWPKAASAAAAASGSAPPERRLRCTAGRPDTPPQRCAQRAAPMPSCSCPTRWSSPARPGRPRSQRPPGRASATRAQPTPRCRACGACCSPWRQRLNSYSVAAFCVCSTSLIDPPFAWRSASS